VRLTIGSKVVYPYQGPCLVGAVVKRVIAGEPRSFYHLVVLNGSGGELFVPVDKVHAVGIRPLAPRSDVPKLLGQESWTLVRARNLLVCEIFEVMTETKSAVEEQVDQALKSRKIVVVSGKLNYHPIGELSQNM
jgi:hypothetical protein